MAPRALCRVSNSGCLPESPESSPDLAQPLPISTDKSDATDRSMTMAARVKDRLTSPWPTLPGVRAKNAFGAGDPLPSYCAAFLAACAFSCRSFSSAGVISSSLIVSFSSLPVNRNGGS